MSVSHVVRIKNTHEIDHIALGQSQAPRNPPGREWQRIEGRERQQIKYQSAELQAPTAEPVQSSAILNRNECLRWFDSNISIPSVGCQVHFGQNLRSTAHGL